MGGATFLGNMWYVPCVGLRAHLAGPSLQAKPANGPHIAQAPFSILATINCKPNLRGGKLVWRSQSDALGARCVFCNFRYFNVPTWEVALVTFQAPQVEHICGIRGHWCQVIVFRRIGRLLNPSRRYYNIFVRLSRHFWVFPRQYCFFLPVMMSSGDLVSQRCAQLTS